MRGEWVGRWTGRTVVCIASGPSLTKEDCETVRISGHPVIVTNTTFRMCPWADALLAHDGKWWKEYREEVEATFKGDRLTCSSAGAQYGAKSLLYQAWYQPAGNSGASAVSLAVSAGAAKIVLLGFDCQNTGGRVHWHGDHPSSLGNARTIANWPKQFDAVSRITKGIQVINCSRQTILTCWPRGDLAESL